jgi:hypothetical protein
LSMFLKRALSSISKQGSSEESKLSIERSFI